jgi:hypothetical protein
MGESIPLKFAYLFKFFNTGSYYVAQASLEFFIFPFHTSSAGTIGTPHHTPLNRCVCVRAIFCWQFKIRCIFP